MMIKIKLKAAAFVTSIALDVTLSTFQYRSYDLPVSPLGRPGKQPFLPRHRLQAPYQ